MNDKSVEILVQAVQDLSLARSIQRVQEIVRNTARKLTGADGATFVLRDNGYCYYADEDAISPLWKGQRFPMQACISGWVMMNKKRVVIEDIYKDERIPIEAYRPTFVKSLTMVPIRSMDPIGAIGNYWADQHVPSEEEIKMLQSLADITAVTMENVKMYEELEQRVKDRTLELEELNKELQSFTYSVSHDLHAPLRAINNYIHILHEDHSDQLNEEGAMVLDRVIFNVNDMRQLIDDLLSFFRMGKIELVKVPIAMKALVADVYQKIMAQEKGRNIQVKIAELPDAEGEETLIRQVWVNFISNAVKYTSKKEVAQIEIGFEDKGNQWVYFVKDNGAGFDMNYYHKLFGVFQRLHSKTEFEGTGVGLATAKKIISKHKGNIWAEAKPGEGATFYFSLPKSK